MDVNLIAASGASWFWDKYGKDIVDKAFLGIKEGWGKINWQNAESKYRARLKSQHSTTRLLGRPKPIDIEGVYTDVHVLDQLTAFRRFDINKLQEADVTDRENLNLDKEQKRYPVLDIIQSDREFALKNFGSVPNPGRLFVLGKPGAGKTTLLKYLTILACDGKISKTPIFVSIKEWADSGLELIPFMEKQFDICGFPDASPFVSLIISSPNTLVLFDGLDEVNQEDGRRDFIISRVNEFTKKYIRPQICLTCRIASVDYSFSQFHYVEVADFNDAQVKIFAKKWFGDDQQKYNLFWREFNKRENQPIRELSRTPLLLTLLALGFDETVSFPTRRVDLYKEAVDALLKKWDSSRGISRASFYKHLSVLRKEQLLARLAAQNFAQGRYFIRQDILERQISLHLNELPNSKTDNDWIDGGAILRTIEAQHGLLVERAEGIYSFSHLTFQEYFTAKYIVDNVLLGTLDDLFEYLNDPRWAEVFLLTASLLDNADHFFDLFLKKSADLMRDMWLNQYLYKWLDSQLAKTSEADSSFVAYVFMVIVALLYEKPGQHTSTSEQNHSLFDYSYNAEITFSLYEAKKLFYQLSSFENSDLDKLISAAMYYGRLENPKHEHYVRFAAVIDYIQNLLLSKRFFMTVIRMRPSTISYLLKADEIESFGQITSGFKMNVPKLGKAGLSKLFQNIKLSKLFVDCLEVSAVSTRKELLQQFFAR
jgi:hypothetical protein